MPKIWVASRRSLHLVSTGCSREVVVTLVEGARDRESTEQGSGLASETVEAIVGPLPRAGHAHGGHIDPRLVAQTRPKARSQKVAFRPSAGSFAVSSAKDKSRVSLVASIRRRECSLWCAYKPEKAAEIAEGSASHWRTIYTAEVS